MSQREELYELVDQLDDNEVRDVLIMIHWLRNTSVPSGQTPIELLARQMASGIMPGWLFFAGSSFKPVTLESAGVGQTLNFDDLLDDFWPEGESIDNFITTIRKWRRGEDV